ncbi:hypothetical protein PY793_11130 [Acetobacter fabarum]|uniref:hypothetical protein n=1 Tax=Acetobacter fabarum TaxID=483199 RepID=UPI00312B3F47
MKANFKRMTCYGAICFAVLGLAAAVSPVMADAQPDVSVDSAKNSFENGHSMRPLWVLVAQRGPDNEDAMITASFYTKAACEDALKFFREQQEHPNREFHGACLPSGAA